MESKKYTLTDIRGKLKPRDSWWTVWVIDPLAIRITLIAANHTRLRASFFTLLSLFSTLLSGFLFLKGHFLAGAVVYEISFLFDCIDGKLASLKNEKSIFGMWFDSFVDKIRLIWNTFALSYNRFPELGLVFVGLYLWDEAEGQLFLKIRRNSNGKTEGKLSRVENFLKKHRLAGPFTLVEQDTLAFFLGPLLKRPEWGFMFAIAINILHRIVMNVVFWRFRVKGKNQ